MVILYQLIEITCIQCFLIVGMGDGVATTVAGATAMAPGNRLKPEHFYRKKYADMKEHAFCQDVIVHEVFERLKQLDYDGQCVDRVANEDKDQHSFQEVFEIMLETISTSLLKIEECHRRLEQHSKEIEEIST